MYCVDGKSIAMHAVDCSERSKPTDFVLLSIILDWGKGASRGYQSLAFRPLVDILRIRFVESSGIAQGEDHRTVHMLGHFLDDLLGESLGLGGCANQYMRLDLFDH